MSRARESSMLRRVLALISCTWPATALGAPTLACSGPEITVTVPAGETWRTLRADLVEHLRALHDLDPCARIRVEPHGDGLRVDVETGDGRVASRQVASEAELLRASEALLTLPPQPAPSTPASSAAASPLELPPSDPAPTMSAEQAQVELAAGASLRIGGRPLFAGGGLSGFADIVLDRWLLGVSARWDVADVVTEPTLMDYRMISAGIGVNLGRRWQLDHTSLDVLVGPNVVIENQDADYQERDIYGSAADLRLDLGVRISGPRRSRWRVFFGADAEASPARLKKQRFVDPALPPLPSWSAGLSLGVCWSTR